MSTERRGELIRTGVTAGETATYFDRDFWAGCILFGLSVFGFVFAGCWVTQYPDRRDDEEQARRVRHLSNILDGPL